MNRIPFAVGEWYHCYTRGVDKRRTFETPADYRRFMELLYICNSNKPHWRQTLAAEDVSEIFLVPRGGLLVQIGAYCLMPNHFHLLLHETEERGIARFMQKLGTAYAMYFNAKYERVGNLFVKPFRSRHVADDRYLKHIVNYIHLNAAELAEPDWKKGVVTDFARLREKLAAYPYGSFPDYLGALRPHSNILHKDAVELLRPEDSIESILEEAAAYYAEFQD